MDLLESLLQSATRVLAPDEVSLSHPEIRTTPKGMMGDQVSQKDAPKAPWLFRDMGLLGADEQLLLFEDVKDWFQAGGETYQAISRLKTTLGDRLVVAKSVISLDRERGNSMLARRMDLESGGISIPRLFYTEMSEDGKRASTFYEEFILDAVDLRDYVDLKKRGPLPDEVSREIGFTAAVLDKRGYDDLDFLREMILDVRNNKVYFVDFGYDLGEAKDKASEAAFLSLKQHFSGRPEEAVVMAAYKKSTKG